MNLYLGKSLLGKKNSKQEINLFAEKKYSRIPHLSAKYFIFFKSSFRGTRIVMSLGFGTHYLWAVLRF